MDSQRLLLIIALGFVLLLLWQNWMQDYGPGAGQAPVEAAAPADGESEPADLPELRETPADTAPDTPAAGSGTAAADVPQGPASDDADLIRVETDVLDVRIDPRGGVLARADLLEYPVSLDQPDTPLRLLERRPGRVFVAQSGLRAADGPAPDHHAEYASDRDRYTLEESADRVSVPLTWEQDGIRVTKTLTFRRGSYVVEVDHRVENTSGETWRGSQYRQLQRSAAQRESAFLYTYTGGVYAGDKVDVDERIAYEKVDFEELGKGLDQRLEGGWTAMIQHYFVGAWIPVQDQVNRFYGFSSDQDGRTLYSLGMITDPRSLAPGESLQFSSRLYVGPKVQERLESIAEGLELTVDYGIFTIISKPIFAVLKFFHDWVGNWGWSIVLVTLLIKLVFWKLSATSYRSMARMRKVQPKLQQLKERYGEDRQRMGQEMMKLYKQEKINPLGGCLPILVQIPVFISLYWVLLESVELRQAPWILWINDLSQKDPFFVLPVLMAASMWLQQRLNPAPMDPVQQRVFQIMPFAFGVFFAFFPAGLVLYWLTNNLLSIGQQWYILRQVEKQSD